MAQSEQNLQILRDKVMEFAKACDEIDEFLEEITHCGCKIDMMKFRQMMNDLKCFSSSNKKFYFNINPSNQASWGFHAFMPKKVDSHQEIDEEKVEKDVLRLSSTSLTMSTDELHCDY